MRCDYPLGAASTDQEDALWLAQQIYELGGIEFGSFTLGRSTVNSPVFVNPKRLIAIPAALRVAAQVIRQQAQIAITRRHHPAQPFELVTGVPMGGLHLATAYSLSSDTPLIYVRPGGAGACEIEGQYLPGQHVLVIDDLITTGGSVVQTAQALRRAGLTVREVVVLVDRDQGAARKLGPLGLQLMPILSLRAMLNYYMSNQWIGEADYQRSLDYIEANQA